MLKNPFIAIPTAVPPQGGNILKRFKGRIAIRPYRHHRYIPAPGVTFNVKSHYKRF